MSTFIDGLNLGSIYALIALGYTMVYGIAKMLNFAHGDIIMVGSYALLTTIALTSNPVVAIIAAIIICIVLGIVIEKVAYKPLRGASPLAVLITAIGVSYLLQSIAQLIYGSAARPVVIYDFPSVEIGSLRINIATIITLAAGALIMVGLSLFVQKTRTGRAMVAVSEDKGAAQLMGINVNRIIMITFAVGSALAGAASVFYLMAIPSTTPTLGAMPGIKAFTAAVIGGIGSIPALCLAAFCLVLSRRFALAFPYLLRTPRRLNLPF